MDLMSIGTLLAYTMVSACVIILRYKQTEADVLYGKERNIEIKESGLLAQIFNTNGSIVPSSSSSNVASVATLILSIDSFIICLIMANFRREMADMSDLGILLVFLVSLKKMRFGFRPVLRCSEVSDHN